MTLPVYRASEAGEVSHEPDSGSVGTSGWNFKAATRPDRWKLAVEFRDPSWLVPDVLELLDRRSVALCLHDMPPHAVTEPNNAGFVYVRRHGPAGGYRGSYSAESIEGDARRVAGWLAKGRPVFFYFNNDIDGCAIGDVQRLSEAIAAHR